MYEKEKQPKKGFTFDLEKEIEESPSHGKKLLEMAERKALEIKNILRTGAKEEEFDRLGLWLHGYTALQKILKKITK